MLYPPKQIIDQSYFPAEADGRKLLAVGNSIDPSDKKLPVKLIIIQATVITGK